MIVVFWSFYECFICLKFHHSIPICHMLYCFFNLTLILLIFFIFFLDPFVKILLVFNFIIQFKLTIYYIFQFDPHSFDFFILLFKFLFFSVSPFDWKFIVFLWFIFYFDFYPYSFNRYFLKYFWILFFYFRSFVWLFFFISSFNTWFVRDWVSWFFHVRCIRFNDSGHRFE
jgi:hypothetical protein